MSYQSREPDPFRKLQEAEEDREIALNLLKRVEGNLDLIANTKEMLHEKRDALVRGIERLEERKKLPQWKCGKRKPNCL